MTDYRDIAEKLRLKNVVDQSSVTIPPQTSVGDLPTIFGQITDDNKGKHYTIISSREAAVCALLESMKQNTSDIDEFTSNFLNAFYVLKGSVKGYKIKKMAEIVSGNVQYERKLEFARIKNREKEDFV